MKLHKLDKGVLKLWYIRSAIVTLVPLGIFAGAAVILKANDASSNVTLAVLLGIGIPVVLCLGLTWILPALHYQMYEWGYDDKRIVVKQGVIFKQRVVIPVCQIQELHRTQGPLMILLGLSGVTISTAGSNFDISTLTTAEADRMIDELEHNLAVRIEEQKHEAI